MFQNTIKLSLLCAAVAVSADRTFYPNTTGPYRVGYKHLELVDYKRPDIFAQSPSPRDLMTTLYYPIENTQKTCTIQPLLGPHLAAYLDGLLSTPPGTFTDFALPACANASLARPDLPLVLFSHGYRGSRLLYSGFLQEFASYGYNILAVDHPSDAQVVEYPDGRFVYNSLGDDAPYDIEQALHVRVQDMIFALNAMGNKNITSRIPGLSYKRLQTTGVGILGHSLGGATTFQSTANDTRFIAGTSFDGPFWGSANQTGTDAPYMLMAALEPSNAYWESEWTTTWPLLRSAKGWFNVAGSLHLSFDDFPLLSELLGAGTGGILGNVTGTRMIEIQSTFTKSFFNQFLKNETDGLFEGGINSDWPEVSLVMS
ncbi:platelet-activating factor acetylhydrolase [Xylaria bambusicola]|uniref:platelet-activating factor acetylhydrolase n=1 Tax=Xylaria bambusicola TaxID=326684 RepID=UPI002007F3F1|nr:platelet-activating factor acetylhydrolase [Xylaria bambusicola]KAI0509012.1 platelet-activating factor acetylhydrolase [Xylaria bambusicola]